jgi:hypothetical protein
MLLIKVSELARVDTPKKNSKLNLRHAKMMVEHHMFQLIFHLGIIDFLHENQSIDHPIIITPQYQEHLQCSHNSFFFKFLRLRPTCIHISNFGHQHDKTLKYKLNMSFSLQQKANFQLCCSRKIKIWGSTVYYQRHTDKHRWTTNNLEDSFLQCYNWLCPW